jgi:hypothetical protein
VDVLRADRRDLFDAENNPRPIKSLTKPQAGQIAAYQLTKRTVAGVTTETFKVKFVSGVPDLRMAAKYFEALAAKKAVVDPLAVDEHGTDEELIEQLLTILNGVRARLGRPPFIW